MAFTGSTASEEALKRLYVHESQYDEVVAMLADYVSKVPVGNGLDASTLIGPVSNRMQLEKVEGIVQDTRIRGARVYFLVWREKIVPTLGFVVIDFQQKRSSGRIVGYEDFECRTLTSFPVGARMRML